MSGSWSREVPLGNATAARDRAADPAHDLSGAADRLSVQVAVTKPNWPANARPVGGCALSTGFANDSDEGRAAPTIWHMFGPATDPRIYLLDDDGRRIVSGGPAVIAPDGTREEIPPLAYRAVQHVLAAMRAGRAV